MILAGKPRTITPRGILTSASILERMAEKSGRPIELAADAAYLSVGRTTWYAPLEPVAS